MPCFVLVLVLAGLSAAQSTDPGQNPASDQTPRAAVVDQRSEAADSQADTSIPTGTVPTAAQVTKDGERAPDPADGTAPATETATNSLKPPQPPQAPATPEPAKYDVTLIGHRNIGNGLNFYSIEREIALGHDLAKQVEGSTKLISDPEITEYVNRIGQNLVRNSDSRVPFTIKVIDSNEVNAFALPGGFFFVDSGLILAADSEAELAAVMAHEIAHVAARHATKNMTKQQIWNMASIPLMFVGGPAGYAIAELASIAVPLGFLKFSRDAEREADMLGLEYDYVAGYDPQAFIQFFERLKAEEKEKHSKIAKMFSTHPMTADRISAAQAEIKMYFPDRESYLVDTSEFDNMKARLMALQGGHRLDVGMGNMPVLRNHTQDTEPDVPATTQKSSTTQPDANDSDRPTLKRTPANPD
ncbi:MAG: M48 family metallopeptidase [Candidatus Korobacteraceae bacterium]